HRFPCDQYSYRLPHSPSFLCPVDHRDLHPFPTRRSSDLEVVEPPARALTPSNSSRSPNGHRTIAVTVAVVLRLGWLSTWSSSHRSEEHTSELQSRFDLVCRLLLEKKKN